VHHLVNKKTLMTYEPVLRSRVLQEPTVYPLSKVSATFYGTCKFSNVRKDLSGEWTDPQIYESIAHFPRLPLDPFFYPLNANLNFVHLTTLSVVQTV
jgi:hypothetical protein